MPSTANDVVNRRVNPLLATLPRWVETFRPEQVRAIGQIAAALDDVDVVVLDAPTGSGKTLIAETVRLMRRERGVYVCSSIGLQDQFARDFSYARVVKGRRNYPTEGAARRFPYLSCDDCQWTRDSPKCQWCVSKRQCPYEMAKVEAIRAELAVVNSAYALTEWNGPGRLAGRDLAIVDEADTFEGAVMNHVSVAISARRMAQYGWDAPDKVTVVDSWKEWLDHHVPLADKMAASETVEKEAKTLARLADSLRVVRHHLESGIPYAYTGDTRRVEWKPAYVGDYCKEAMWRHAKKWLLMSATVISSSSLLRGLGWDGRYTTVQVPSSFPAENRRVIVRGVGNMSRRSKDTDFERLASEVRSLVEGVDARVVVHTVSYQLAGDIYERLQGLGRRVISYRMAGDRATAISEYTRTPRSVLVAATADRGVDLPDELCRRCIIVKVPYPNLGDRMVRMRAYMGSEGRAWYASATVRSIVQMAGRGVRHKDDWCETFILDSQFGEGVWSRSRHLFPAWFREAMVWETRR
jgi:ATP-dependent DNA helicase DinG